MKRTAYPSLRVHVNRLILYIQSIVKQIQQYARNSIQWLQSLFFNPFRQVLQTGKRHGVTDETTASSVAKQQDNLITDVETSMDREDKANTSNDSLITYCTLGLIAAVVVVIGYLRMNSADTLSLEVTHKSISADNLNNKTGIVARVKKIPRLVVKAASIIRHHIEAANKFARKAY